MHVLIILSSILGFVGPVIYIASILHGTAKPHRTTRLVLFLISILGTISMFLIKDYANVWLFASYTVGNFILFLLSIKYGVGGWARGDIFCLFIACAGIVVWQVSDNPVIALYASVLADGVGFIPTLFKTYIYPHTEVWQFYFCDLFASVLIIIAHDSITFNEMLYPLYLVVVNMLMIVFIARKREYVEVRS